MGVGTVLRLPGPERKASNASIVFLKLPVYELPICMIPPCSFRDTIF
ncbi:MAG: hypothetical protein PUH50_00195 [Firmicutes bacterium]|nr:hypothetical protein [Bacillota bacterium]